MTRGILFYGHVASNWGDLAINYGAVELMRAAGIDVDASTAVRLRPADEFSMTAGLSLEPLENIDAPSVPMLKGNWEDELNILVDYLDDPMRFANDFNITEYDHVFLNGGEHLFEGAPQANNAADLIWRVLPAIAASEAGVPATVLPSTLGPFRTPFGQALRDFLKASTSGAYRDAASLKLSGSSNTSNWPVHLDAAFFAQALERSSATSDSLRHVTLIARMEDFGIRAGTGRSNFVRAKFEEERYRNSRAFQAFATVGEHLLEQGETVAVVVQTRADRELAAALYEHLSDVSEATESGSVSQMDPDSFEEFARVIRDSKAVITSRFHAAILGLAQGVPAVGIYSETHGHKMPGLFDAIGRSECSVRLDLREVSGVADEILNAISTAGEAIETVESIIQARKADTLTWLKQSLKSPAKPASTESLRIKALAALHRFASERQRTDDMQFIRGKLASISAKIPNNNSSPADE